MLKHDVASLCNAQTAFIMFGLVFHKTYGCMKCADGKSPHYMTVLHAGNPIPQDLFGS